MKQLVRLYAAGLELTLACPCACTTCGSNAGRPRPRELTLDQWISVLDNLKTLGCKRVGLLGGEPLRFADWQALALAGQERGFAVEMITSGIGLDRHAAALAASVNMSGVTVSVDGTEQTHDDQRRIPNAYRQAMDAIRYLDEAGIRAGVNTQINALSLPTLWDLAPKLEAAGAVGWQLQLTMPRGRASGRDDIALPPEAMPEVFEVIRRLVDRRGLRPTITDNIGYLTRDDPRLRTPPGVSSRCWLGCFAGLRVIGIMSDGGVKGCLALPDETIEGNLLNEPLEEIWNDMSRFQYNRAFDESRLDGACAECRFGAVCRGGCTAFAMSVHGKPNISTHCVRCHQ
jgi:radical SAM protein with 4Fe4S-binding SPASM domain